MRLRKLKREKNVCKHKHLVFIGKQEIPSQERFLALFNCLDCRTTISLKLVKPGEQHRKAS